MAKRKSQSEHDGMVEAAAQHLVNERYSNVKADIDGWDTPGKKSWKSSGKGHVPDVEAEGQPDIIMEVETGDSIADAHTEDQWSLFARFVEQHGGEFCVLVPEAAETDAKRRLEELGLQASVWTI